MVHILLENLKITKPNVKMVVIIINTINIKEVLEIIFFMVKDNKNQIIVNFLEDM